MACASLTICPRMVYSQLRLAKATTHLSFVASSSMAASWINAGKAPQLQSCSRHSSCSPSSWVTTTTKACLSLSRRVGGCGLQPNQRSSVSSLAQGSMLRKDNRHHPSTRVDMISIFPGVLFHSTVIGASPATTTG